MKTARTILMLTAVSILASACAVPAEPQVWYASDPDIAAALADAADALCEHTEGAYCPAYTTDPGAATRKIVAKRLNGPCGQEKHLEDMRDAKEIAIDLERVQSGEGCTPIVPSEEQKSKYNVSVPPPEPLEGPWRMANTSEALNILVAHELGHAAGWGHVNTPGELMQAKVGYVIW